MNSLNEKVNGTVEKMGRKLQDQGHIKTGVVVEKLGDKIEHIAD